MLGTLYQKFPLPSYIWQRHGDDFLLVGFNDAARDTTDGSVESFLGRRLTDIYDAQSEIAVDIRAAYDERTLIQKEIEYRFASLDRTSLLKTTCFFAEPDFVVVFTEDVTDLRANEKVLGAIVDGITEAVIGVDRNGRITFANRAACSMFGYSQDELTGREIEVLVPDGVRDTHVRHRAAYMESPRTRPMGENLTLTAQRRDGTVFPVEIGLDFVAQEGGTTAVVALISDATERRAFEAALEEAAATDPLTGLPNRRAFQAALSSEHGRARRYSHPFSIVLGDIDHFKKLNDTFGHDFGDEVLVGVAHRLREGLREHDAIARWGGEEFILLLPETSIAGAAVVAEKLRRFVEELAFFPKESNEADPVKVTMSLGAAESTEGADVGAVVIAADKRLYLAKEGGRNRVVS